MEVVDVDLDPIRRARGVAVLEVDLPARMLPRAPLEPVAVALGDETERTLNLRLLAKDLLALHRHT
jgi:hypothetical protein